MIITCKECSTSFNLDDSLVKESGRKCRCSVCKHIFTAYPLAMDDDQKSEDSLELQLESDSSDFELEENDLSFEEDNFDIDDDNSRKSEEDGTLDIGDDEFELEFNIEDDTKSDDTALSDDNISLELESTQDENAISDEEYNTQNLEQEPYAITPEEKFSEYDEVLNQETEPEDEEDYESIKNETTEIDDSNDIDKEEITTLKEDIGFEDEVKPVLAPAATSRRKKRKNRLSMPVLMLLLIFLLVFGAYIASIMTGYKIPYISDIQIPLIEQYLKKPASEISEVKPVPNQKSVNGRFVNNSTAGTLFVITGRVENASDITYSQIQIQGALITKNRQEAKIKNVFCGNIIPEDMLQTGNIADINKLLAVKNGTSNLNANVKPKSSIPFMIVFSELPEKLQNFTVKVIGFKKTGDDK